MATTCVPESGGMVVCRKAGADAWDDREFAAHLAARSVPVGIGGVGAGEDDTGPFVRIHLPTGYDPTADVEAFSPAADPYRQAKTYLRSRAKTIRAKAPATRTEAERDLLALLVALREE